MKMTAGPMRLQWSRWIPDDDSAAAPPCDDVDDRSNLFTCGLFWSGENPPHPPHTPVFMTA
ncbi:hypothetical protein Hanom_Chr16g01448561 [Helianthus anomalus]